MEDPGVDVAALESIGAVNVAMVGDGVRPGFGIVCHAVMAAAAADSDEQAADAGINACASPMQRGIVLGIQILFVMGVVVPVILGPSAQIVVFFGTPCSRRKQPELFTEFRAP